MKILFRLIGFLVLAIAILMGVGMLLPREVTVERATVIDAPASAIYPHIANLEATKAWSPWLALDPETKLTFNDIAEGPGATMAWDSDDPQVGKGRMEITEATPDTGLKIALDFGDMGNGEATWNLAEADGKTTATWGMTADMGAGPIGRWIGLKMDDWVGADYEKGLANLKDLVESN